MVLDYNSTTKAFILRVGRQEGQDVQSLMQDHGLNLSLPVSTAGEAVL